MADPSEDVPPVLIRIPEAVMPAVDTALVAEAFERGGMSAGIEPEPEGAEFLGALSQIVIEILRDVGIELLATATWETIKPGLVHLAKAGRRVLVFIRGGDRPAQAYVLPSADRDLEAALAALGPDIAAQSGASRTTVRSWSADGRCWEVERTVWR